MVTSKQVSITYAPADCGSIIPGKSKAPWAFQHVRLADKIHAACQHKPREQYALESPARFSAATSSPGGVRNEDVNVSVCQAVDSIDAGTFPLANVPNFTGVEFEVMMRALRVLLGSSQVIGLSVAGVNPDHDAGFVMIEKLASHIADMLGARST